MKAIRVKDIKDILGATLLVGSDEKEFNGVVIDSRQAKAGDLFFPIVGENHDGHIFLEKAFDAGCDMAIVSNEEISLEAAKDRNVTLLFVEDTVKALQHLAKWYISLFDIMKIAVTGSTGKTSTRDMLHAIMSEKYVTIKPIKNFNNEIGLPLTAFLIDEDTEAAIFEMGTESLGEIHLLADIVRPHVAVITNVGMSHIETIGSREGILKAKLEITDFLKQEDSLIIYEEELLTRISAKGNYILTTVSANKEKTPDYTVLEVMATENDGVDFKLMMPSGEINEISLPVPGEHNAHNAAVAIAATEKCSVTIEEAKRGLLKMALTEKRLSIKEKDGIKVIDDTYNASPDSMKAGVSVLMNSQGDRKIAILGDMFGLGESSEEAHRVVGRFVAEKCVDLLITIGNASSVMGEEIRDSKTQYIHFLNVEDAIKEIGNIIKSKDTILVKASRAMKLEDIVNKILN